jgi:Predicted membrane protein (DUF2306)
MGERRMFWAVMLPLCGIAIAISLRRLLVLSDPAPAGDSESAALDAIFATKPVLTASHVVTGLLLTIGIPAQFSTRVRQQFPQVHRWLGRVLLVVGVAVGLSAYGLMREPVGGWVETSATGLYGTAFLAALVIGWRRIRQRDLKGHRRWMLRAVGIALGIAATRPVMAVFFATSPMTGLKPPQFFGIAMWVGFTATVLVTEWYIRRTSDIAAA